MMIAFVEINRFLSMGSPRMNPPLQVIDPVAEYVRLVTLVAHGENMILA